MSNPTLVTVQEGHGHTGYGFYYWFSEYPEEGSSGPWASLDAIKFHLAIADTGEGFGFTVFTVLPPEKGERP